MQADPLASCCEPCFTCTRTSLFRSVLLGLKAMRFFGNQLRQFGADVQELEKTVIVDKARNGCDQSQKRRFSKRTSSGQTSTTRKSGSISSIFASVGWPSYSSSSEYSVYR